MITLNVKDLVVDDVMKVYSGKPGCMCGCLGNYRVNPQYLKMANESRGYDYEASDVNLAQVKRVLRILQMNSALVERFEGGFYLKLQTGPETYRSYAVYTVI